MKIPKSLIYTFAVIGFAFVFFVLFVKFGPIPNCEVTVLKVALSPSKQHEAKLYINKCNNKTDPELELDILSKANPNAIHGFVIGSPTTTDIDLTWLSGNKLQVSYPRSFRLDQEPREIDNIEIVFVAKSISNTAFERDGEKRAAPQFER